MKTSFMLPSASYNVVLSKEELEQIIEKGFLIINISHTNCSTGRARFNNETGKLETIDKKNIPNNLWFHLSEPVGGIMESEWGLQFINILVEKENEND